MSDDRYTDDDKVCAHCGGTLSWHSTDDFGGARKWCDDCGSNSPSSPPYVGVELHEPQ